MLKDTVSVKCESVYKFESMECVIFKVAPSITEADKHLIVIYRHQCHQLSQGLNYYYRGNCNAIMGHHTSW